MPAALDSSTTLVDAALAYAAIGWRVVPLHTPRADGSCTCDRSPCRSPGKHPRIDAWPRQATTDVATIRRWWTTWPDANVGMVLGDGLIDIEVDPRHGGDDRLPAVEQRLGELPDTVTWTSGGGGAHRLFRAPDPATIRNATSIGRDVLGVGTDGSTGIDVRSEGGLAVLPPSVHANGVIYRWGNLHPSAIAIAPLPPAWIEYLAKPSAPSAQQMVVAGNPIPEGSRNDTLARLAGTMRRVGMTENELAAALGRINKDRCQPPLEDSEVATIARSIARYEPDQAMMATMEGWAQHTLGASTRRLAFQWFSETLERKPDWLWRGYLLRGATAVVGGRQGTSKGLFTVDIAARLSRGDVMPDGSGGGTPCRVLIITREDDPEVTLVRRLRLAGADMGLIAWSRGDFSDHVPIATMASAATYIAELVREQGIGLVVIDPLGAWIEDDANNGQQIRAVIDPMNRVAADTGCAVLFVAHLRKASAEDPMDAFAGSVQVTAACRTALLIAPNGSSDERLVRVVKTNFRRPEVPLVYRLRTVTDDPDDPPVLDWRPATGEDLAIAATAGAGSASIVPLAVVLEHIPEVHRPLKDVARAARKALLPTHRGITIQGVVDALTESISTGAAHEGTDPHGARTIGRQPPRPAESASDRAAAYWQEHPEATVREVAQAVGCSVGLASVTRRLVFTRPVQCSLARTRGQ